MFCQTIDITPQQQERIKDVLTPQRIIDLSKCVSNEKVMDSVLISRDIQINELNIKIELLKEEHKNTLIAIAKEKETIKDTSGKIDDISDEELKNEKFKWKGIHLYAGVEIPKFEFSNIIPNAELMYEFRRLHFGLKAQLEPIPSSQTKGFDFNYLIKLKYKIF